MKRVLVGALALALAANPSFAGPKKVAQAIKHNFIGVFKDLKDPEWAATSGVYAGAEAYDAYTTCEGFGVGLRESNPLYAHASSCAKLNLLNTAYTLIGFTAAHYLREKFVQACTNDALSDPKRWEGYNPGSCKHMDLLLPIAAVPRITAGISNQNLIDSLHKH